MNKSLFYLLTIFTLFTNAQERQLSLAADLWPPFTDIEGEKSILTDLVQEALNRIEIQSTVETIAFTEIFNEINSGKFDGSPALWINDQREEN